MNEVLDKLEELNRKLVLLNKKLDEINLGIADLTEGQNGEKNN